MVNSTGALVGRLTQHRRIDTPVVGNPVRLSAIMMPGAVATRIDLDQSDALAAFTIPPLGVAARPGEVRLTALPLRMFAYKVRGPLLVHDRTMREIPKTHALTSARLAGATKLIVSIITNDPVSVHKRHPDRPGSSRW